MHMTVRPGVAGLGCEGCPGSLTGCQGCAGLFSKLRKSIVGKTVKKILAPIQKVGTKLGSPVRVAMRKFDPVTMLKVAAEKKKSSGGGGGGGGGSPAPAPAPRIVYVPQNVGASPYQPYPAQPYYYAPQNQPYPQQSYAPYVAPAGYEDYQTPAYDNVDLGPDGQPIVPEDYLFPESGGVQESADGGNMDANGMTEEEIAADYNDEYMPDGLEGVGSFRSAASRRHKRLLKNQPHRAIRRGLHGLGATQMETDMFNLQLAHNPGGAPSASAPSSGPSSGDISNILSSIVTGAASVGQALLQGKAQVAAAKANAAAGGQNVFVPAQNQNFRPAGLPQGAAVPGWVWLAGAAVAALGVLSIMKRK